MVPLEGVEPSTFPLGRDCSIHLSYKGIAGRYHLSHEGFASIFYLFSLKITREMVESTKTRGVAQR